jgi:membrane-associated phospholipid phosphatase
MRPPVYCTELGLFRKRILLERVLLTAGLMTFFVAGYFGVGLSRNLPRAHVLTTVLDDRIPFVAGSVWVYLWVFPCALIPLFVVRCPRLFRRTVIAYAAVMAISFVSFTVFPVTSAHLRVPKAVLDISNPSDWAVSILYSIDPPYNLLPSLHLSLAALAAFSVWKAAKPYAVAIFVSVGCLGVSVCTVKQHYLLDVLSGLALAALANLMIIRRYRPMDRAALTYSWRGPTTYLIFVAILYASFYADYLWSL